MDLCTFLLSSLIVGAVETRPGIMYVELLDTSTETIEELYVYTDSYLKCWEPPIFPGPGPVDSGGTSTPSDS